MSGIYFIGDTGEEIYESDIPEGTLRVDDLTFGRNIFENYVPALVDNTRKLDQVFSYASDSDPYFGETRFRCLIRDNRLKNRFILPSRGRELARTSPSFEIVFEGPRVVRLEDGKTSLEYHAMYNGFGPFATDKSRDRFMGLLRDSLREESE